MYREKEQEILEKYSFFHPNKPLSESLMAFGFECGKGWFGIIEEMCEKLSKVVPEDFEIIQVKEKFGGLRVYSNFSNDEIDKIITEAEIKAESTCEICGDVGKERGGSWIRTLCDKCNGEKR